jgi:cobalt-zinc-cadmium efflux system outer membrane protein
MQENVMTCFVEVPRSRRVRLFSVFRWAIHQIIYFGVMFPLSLGFAGAQEKMPEVLVDRAEPLTLRQAVDRVLSTSPRIQSAQAGIETARGTELQSAQLPNPELSFDVENFGGGSGRNADRAEITYSLSQRVEIGGERSARRSAAQAERQAAEQASDAARLDLIRDVTIAYIDAASADESLRQAEELEAVAKEILAEVSKRVEAARDPLLQRSKAQVVHASSRLAKARAVNARLASRQRLARFWGENTLSETLAAKDFFTLLWPEPLHTYEARLEDAPDVVLYVHLRDARKAELQLAQVERTPSPKVTAGVRQLRANDEVAFIAGVSLPIPVFDRNRGEIARARAEVARAGSDLQQTGLIQTQRLSEAWNAWQSAALEAEALGQEILPQAERAFQLSLSGFKAGRFAYLDVLDAQRTFFEARNQQVAALVKLHIARAEVERLSASSNSRMMQ